ncbi:DUF499 domain-containing protein [Hyalangium versicolor]|uniref:DUF499 domain-containing protein n=1 Tax=Hyalangium versicolor TaxID=2861190 RepID=UPI001CCAB602|nr:DUF499 domain-containing protein [Hyalangium versicolor]
MTLASWHEGCRVREEVRTGLLRLAEFAADLNAVRTREAHSVYRDAEAFFSRTFPTYNLKRLVRECLQRLAGQPGAPVVRLQVSYGGGKTHTLITLLHLAEQGQRLGEHPVVREFTQFAGLQQLPRARVALLPLDKFDVHEGLQVYGPDGVTRRVRTPWGALAYQLAGESGLARVRAHEDGYDPPAEPLLVELLRMPAAQGLATLVLLDEAVWYCRSAVNEDPRRLGTLKDFFHALIQAVGKVERCSFVATLIASALEAQDVTGGQVLRALEDEFGRAEETVEPVGKDELAEVLRRRLFESVAPEPERRSIVDALMARMQQLPLREGQKGQQAYDRLVRSYPFQPDLLDVLYQKWTQFPGFQRTRGVLRLLALACRSVDKARRDILMGPGALLSHGAELSEAMLELVKQCEGEGDWPKILVGELEKAREVQDAFPSLLAREIEEAVIGTFLHSQPRGQKADATELYALLAHPTVDVSALTEALGRWRDFSWFLSEEPGLWRLGTQPNLTHMHLRALEQISLKPEQVSDELRSRIRAARLGDVEDGVVAHHLPDSPKDVSDTSELHWVVLPPECAVELGKPIPLSAEAYFNTTSGPRNPRTYRNALIAIAPERARLAGLRERVLRVLAWRVVEAGEGAKLLSDVQRKELQRRKREAEDGLPDAVRAAYSVLLAVDEAGAVEARQLSPGPESAFERSKKVLLEAERLLTTSIDPELLLPGSYLDLWVTGERSKQARELVAAFAQLPRLPRLLKLRVLHDSLGRGVREGKIVLQFAQAEGFVRTFWRTGLEPEHLTQAGLEVLPVAFAVLHELDPELLMPGRIEGLWLMESAPLGLARIESMFEGILHPRVASPEVIDRAVRMAVQRGLLMARTGGQVFLRQALPEGPIAHDLELLSPPPAVRGGELGPKGLPEAWSEGHSPLASIVRAIAGRRGHSVPWTLLQAAVSEALTTRLFEVVEEGTWPCAPEEMERVRFRLVEVVELDAAELVSSATQAVWKGSAPTLGKLKGALEAEKGRALSESLFRSAVESALGRKLFTLNDPRKALPSGRSIFDVRVRMPKAALRAEAQLTAQEVQDFAETVVELKRAAPELSFSFRITIAAEGERPSAEALARLNEMLGRVSAQWQLK